MKEKTRTAEELQDALLTILEMSPDKQIKFFPAIVAYSEDMHSNTDGMIWILNTYTCPGIFHGVERYKNEERHRKIEESRAMLKCTVEDIGIDAAWSLLKEITEEGKAHA